MNRIITLLTDFGLNDVYVGVIKGVIAKINPALTVIDLTHEIPPQNIRSAQFNLVNAYPYFPANTVHVVVVDPGVGGKRRPIAIKRTDGLFVGPDNGIFTELVEEGVRVVELTHTQYWRVPEPSHTFHGRDIFAAVGAHLASGVPLTELGTAIELSTLVALPLITGTVTPTGFIGSVQHIDRFGNVITNIPGDYVDSQPWFVLVGKRKIPGCRTYGEAKPGEPLALVGSHGWIEIAINGGDAHFQLRLNWNDSIELLQTT